MHPAILNSYGPRLVIHIVAAVLVLSTLPEAPNWFLWSVLGLGLAWPHLVLVIGYLFPKQQKPFAYNSFFVDGTLVGAYIGLTGFALMPTIAMATVAVASQLLMGGFWLLRKIVVCHPGINETAKSKETIECTDKTKGAAIQANCA